MEIIINPLTIEERKYTYAQSTQICGQTGSIGHLRGDFGTGEQFYTTWNEHSSSLKTPEFISELDSVINELRSSACGLLKSRRSMVDFARKNPESSFKGTYTTEYGFRVDTEKYSYLLRCNPTQGDYNFYCFCYQREWLDNHMKKAERGIRFIDPNYKELFRIPDGDKIRITLSTDEKLDRVCRYIDDYHLEVGDGLYHICEFAERMEQNGNTVIPLRSSLPEQCYVYVQTENEIGIIKKGESGYCKTNIAGGKPSERKALADEYNRKAGVSKAQAEAMKAGSMFGWHTPAADPKNYDENGALIKPKNKNKDRER